jgi:hypothetical protein
MSLCLLFVAFLNETTAIATATRVIRKETKKIGYNLKVGLGKRSTWNYPLNCNAP